jgi:UDP-N-acetyl-2-amino-2-deoxyglucuronate dehydrogenase
MKVGLIGTGAIANMHARAYKNIGFELVACYNKTAARGREFAEKWGAKLLGSVADLCLCPGLDYVDVCSFPDSHLEPVKVCAEIKRPVMLQKPIATNLAEARQMLDLARAAKITLGVMSQHRFDDSTIFLRRALDAGRLGKLLQADAYVKW